MITVYGIMGCDTMKKARMWLEEHGVVYRFHDYKVAGLDESVLCDAIRAHGWETVINRRGTSWRQLPEDVRAGMDADGALAAAQDNASLVKRPLVVCEDGGIVLGFSAVQYHQKWGK